MSATDARMALSAMHSKIERADDLFRSPQWGFEEKITSIAAISQVEVKHAGKKTNRYTAIPRDRVEKQKLFPARKVQLFRLKTFLMFRSP